MSPRRDSDFLTAITISRKTPSRKKRSEEHTSELQSPDHLVCRLLLEKKKLHHRAPVSKWPHLAAYVRKDNTLACWFLTYLWLIRIRRKNEATRFDTANSEISHDNTT